MKTSQKFVGSFQVTGGELLLSDPCYNPDGNCNSVVQNSANGKWNGSVHLTDIRGWGRRVAVLEAEHEDFLQKRIISTTIDGDLGVDSGQMGIFDAVKYPVEPREYDNEEAFYRRVCEMTNPAGVIDNFGIVSSSGFGDGCYDFHVHRDKDGVAWKVTIFFIDEEDDGDFADEVE